MESAMHFAPKALFVYAFTLFLCFGCGKHEDSSNKKSHAPPKRIISLTPSATALLVSLKKHNLLVGRDKYSVTPKEVVALPVVGDFLNPNIEAIAALKPELVLLDASQSNAKNALQTLDIPTLSLKMHTLSDVRTGLIEVGISLGIEKLARKQIADLDTQIEMIRRQGKRRETSPKVLIILDRAPDALRDIISVGPNTYIDELLEIVGATNVMHASTVPYPQISAEQIMRSQPDIILDLSRSQGGKQAYEGIPEVAAVANDRIFLVDNRELLSPSPRVASALLQLQTLTKFP